MRDVHTFLSCDTVHQFVTRNCNLMSIQSKHTATAGGVIRTIVTAYLKSIGATP